MSTSEAEQEVADNEELNEQLDAGPFTGRRRAAPKSNQNDDTYEGEAQLEAKARKGGGGLLSSAGFIQWSTPDERVFIPTSNTCPVLPPAYYEVKSSNMVGTYFEKIPVLSEGLLRFPDSKSDKVLDEIEKFWDREHMFRQYGIAYKRGIILYGPPGGGKSCTIQLVCVDVIARKGVVVKWTNPSLLSGGLRILREIQPNIPIVVLMEDMDSIIEDHSESDVLNMLDGVDRIDKVVFLATTNYPERLGARIINRPSRFDKRIKIGNPNEAARKMYLEHLFSKNGAKADDMDRWVKDTDKLSLAHLKELFVAVTIIGDTYDTALSTLRSMRENISSDHDEDHPVGFGAER